MKRLLLLLSAAIVLLAPAGAAQANHSGPELVTYGKGTVVVPTGPFTDITLRFDFSARLSGHEATDLFGEPHGRMYFEDENLEGSLTAEVTCLNVVGNRAVMSGRITKATGGLAGSAFRSMLFDVTDNTFPGPGNLVPDEWNVVFLEAPALQVCPAPIGGIPISSGDIVVEQN